MTPSVPQLLIVLAVIVLLFGAKRIPELAKGLGKGIKSFKKEMSEDEPTQKIEKADEATQNTTINNTKEA